MYLTPTGPSFRARSVQGERVQGVGSIVSNVASGLSLSALIPGYNLWYFWGGKFKEDITGETDAAPILDAEGKPLTKPTFGSELGKGLGEGVGAGVRNIMTVGFIGLALYFGYKYFAARKLKP